MNVKSPVITLKAPKTGLFHIILRFLYVAYFSSGLYSAKFFLKSIPDMSI